MSFLPLTFFVKALLSQKIYNPYQILHQICCIFIVFNNKIAKF